MGFEIVGLQPEKEVGKSFSNDVWYWRPLWGYIAETCWDILSEEEIEQGTWNDGYEYSRTKAMKLARRLYELLKSGKVDEWGRRYVRALDGLPDEKCSWCRGLASGELRKARGKCSGCEGTGRTKPFVCSYRFSKDNVEAFAEFAEASGGFQVW